MEREHGGLGRARELATAAFARDTARAGTGSALAVTGPPGIGKTWVCETIAEAAEEEGFRVGWGPCWPGGGAPPLWPWQQAVAALGIPLSELFATPPDTGTEAWFRRCVEVVEHLRTATEQNPSVLIVDDAHTADAHSQELAYFVARHVRGLPLVLVLAHEPTERLAPFDREATAIPLHGIGKTDAAALLAGRGLADLDDADLAFVLAATHGLPLDLHRLANVAPGAAGVVRALVADRLATLPPEVQRSAAFAAVLDGAPRLSDVAAVAGGTDDPIAFAVALEEAGLATRRGADGLVFGHEQVRTALAGLLDPDEASDVHARAARLMAGGPQSIERRLGRARHALAVVDRSEGDARLAMQLSCDAAGALVADNDPERAAALLAEAEALHEAAGRGRPPAALLAARAGAVLRCGDLAIAREHFARAATAADEEDDAVSLGLAALGLGGVWLAEARSAIDRHRILSLQRRARDGLPPDQVALRLRLNARLAAEESYATGILTKIEAQVDAARELDDPAVLAEVLSLYHHSMLGPEHGERRQAVAQEMLAVTTRADDNALSLMALLWLTTDLFLAGDRQAERWLGELKERAASLGGRHAAYIASVMDTMLLKRAGRFADAERAAEAAYEVGATVGDADAIAYYGTQIATMRWMQGRSAEVVELAAATAADPTITPDNRAFVAIFASLAADCGETDRAWAALSQLRGQLHTVLSSSAWLGTLFSTVETAYILGDPEIAAEAAALLAPYADLPVIGSLGVSCVGSVRRPLGLAAITVGDLDEGITLLEDAVAHDERLGNRPMAAITVADLAQAHAARGGADDRPTAIALFDRAIREADAMGISVRAADWRARRDVLANRSATAPGPMPGLASDADAGQIRRQGSSWVLEAGRRHVVVPDLLGMTYLARLLTNPGVEIAATALVSESDAFAIQPEQPLLDDAALAAYRSRVAELEDDLAEAESYADSERAARVRVELDALVDELTRTTNRFGKARPFSSSNERARTNVQKALRRVLDAIDAVDPGLAGPLRASLHTGRTCAYHPTPDAPTRWSQQH